MSPARKQPAAPDATVHDATVHGAPDSAFFDHELTATEPLPATAHLVLPARFTIPPHTRVAEIPARVLKARDIARAVRDEVLANVDSDGEPALVELAVRVVALANCVETLCQAIA